MFFCYLGSQNRGSSSLYSRASESVIPLYHAGTAVLCFLWGVLLFFLILARAVVECMRCSAMRPDVFFAARARRAELSRICVDKSSLFKSAAYCEWSETQ